MKKTRLFSVCILMLISNMLMASALSFDSSNPDVIMSFIQGNSVFIYLSAFFGLGLLLAFTPCVLPMVPILSGIIIGQKTMTTNKAFRLSLSYVMGMSLTYALAGMLAGYMGSTIQTLMQRPLVITIFSGIFVVMACSMFGFFDLRLPAAFSNRLNKTGVSNKNNYLSVGVMGVLSTLVVSPCVTAPLIGVLGYIGQNGDVAMGGIILFVMSLGMGVPLLLVGLGYGSLLPKTGSWMLIIKQFFGFVMLAMAIWMLSRILVGMWANLLWAALFIAGGLSFGHSTTSNKKNSVIQCIGFIALICSGFFIHQAFITNEVHEHSTSTKDPFGRVSSMAAIQESLEQARNEKKPVMIEFFATWCSDCQAMESKVFNQPEITKELAGLVALKVDISKKTPEVEQIRQAFGIYGFPTILFFDSEGSALKSLTGVGFIPLDSMLALVNKAKK